MEYVLIPPCCYDCYCWAEGFAAAACRLKIFF